MAQVEKVEAFRAIDGDVFPTHQKAHYRNIWVLTHRIFGVPGDSSDDYDDTSRQSAAKLLHNILIAPNGAPARIAREAIAALAKELE